MSKLRALLVGINNYHPDSNVDSLNGCVNDIQLMESFLRENYGSDKLHINTLLNEAATKKGVINAFHNTFISDTKAGDFVFFAYSGHGSFRSTAKEFEAFDPKRQDETLVCYDSRLPGNFDLSDKELALLLHQIPKGVNIVLVIDSCHSGSISRSTASKPSLGKSRFTTRQDEIPRLENYVVNGDDFYAKMFKDEGKLIIPRTPHIVLAACDRDELAWETDDGRGLFSSILLDVLSENPRVSYANLFAQIRGKVRQTSDIQMPGIYAYEQFNQNQIFLTNVLDQNHNRHLVKHVDNNWIMEYGAIHSLPTDPKTFEKIQVALYPDITEEDQDDVLTFVSIKEVKLKEAVLDFDEADHSALFQAEIVSIPPNLSILLEGKKADKSKFLELYEELASPFILLSDHVDFAKYKLLVDDKKLVLFSTDNNQLIHGIKNTDLPSVKYISVIMEKIEEWERLKNLENKNTTLDVNNIELKFFEEQSNGKLSEKKSDLITIHYPTPNDPSEIKPIWYQIKVKNKGDSNLFLALLHLSADYGITPNFNCQMIPKGSDWITMDDQHGVFISDPNANEVTDIFKIIISTDPFDDYNFASEKFEIGVIKELSRQVISKASFKRKKAEQDWYTQTLIVKTVRAQ